MMRRTALAAALSKFFALPIGAPLTGIANAIEVDGALVNTASLFAALQTLVANGVQADSANFLTTAGATLTLSNLVGLTQRFTNGGAVTVTIDSAYNIVNNIQNPFNGQSFPFDLITIAATTIATPTLSDSSVTLSGTTSLAASTLRRLQGQITQLNAPSAVIVTPGTTWTSLTQVGTTNAYNVVLGTNAVVPVVGQCIYLNVTVGTLPPGFYPICNVTSATSFRIMAPITGTAWTATSVSFPTIALPTAGVFSPLLTITSMWSVVTASA